MLYVSETTQLGHSSLGWISNSTLHRLFQPYLGNKNISLDGVQTYFCPLSFFFFLFYYNGWNRVNPVIEGCDHFVIHFYCTVYVLLVKNKTNKRALTYFQSVWYEVCLHCRPNDFRYIHALSMFDNGNVEYIWCLL